MELNVVLVLLNILKGNEELYNKVNTVFESGVFDEKVITELWEEARKQGVTLELEEMLDEVDEFMRNGFNGMSIQALGGVPGMIQMVEGMGN